jgi:hypothetical protein
VQGSFHRFHLIFSFFVTYFTAAQTVCTGRHRSHLPFMAYSFYIIAVVPLHRHRDIHLFFPSNPPTDMWGSLVSLIDGEEHDLLKNEVSLPFSRLDHFFFGDRPLFLPFDEGRGGAKSGMRYSRGKPDGKLPSLQNCEE